LLIWNPAVNQLGWPMLDMSLYAKKNHWLLGIKNGKWHSMEKTWLGLSRYNLFSPEETKNQLVFIHRGVESVDKGDFRSLPVHEVAKKIKLSTGAKIFFDPSHSYGPKLRDRIVEGTVEAMGIKSSDNSYLYDGILIEVGTSITDTAQHISVAELDELCWRLAKFRNLQSPL
jgi:3-deoxy-D-arabino-heptulosonate 7-phosphate (DAHP) synthase